MATEKLQFPEFDFNSGTYSGLLYQFATPKQILTARGLSRQLQGLPVSDIDYQRSVLPIAFRLWADNQQDLANYRKSLASALNKDNTLTYNRDPATCGDVYIDTYKSPYPATVHNQLRQLANSEQFSNQSNPANPVEILCDPFARGPRQMLAPVGSNANVLLSTGDNPETWAEVGSSGCPKVGIQYSDSLGIGNNNAVYSPHSGLHCVGFDWWGWDTDSYSYTFSSVALKRTDTFSLSPVNPQNISFWLMSFFNFAMEMSVQTPPAYPAITVQIVVGNNSTNYYYYNMPLSGSAYNDSWTQFSFPLSSMSVIGAPSWSSPLTYFTIQVAMQSGTLSPAPSFYIDDVVINVAPNPTPYVTNINVDKGDSFAPFKLYLSMPNAVDNIWIGRKQDNVNSAPLVVDAPTATTGYTTGTLNSGQIDSLNDTNYSYTISNTTAAVFPAKYITSTTAGKYKVLTRLNTADPGGITVAFQAADKNANTISNYLTGDSVSVAASANWQIIDLGNLSLPLKNYTSDVDLSQMFSTVGLQVTGSSGTGYALKVDWILLLPTDGGSIYIAAPSSLSYLIFDTISRNSTRIYGSTDGTDQNAFGLEEFCVGDLEVLVPGDNTLALLAYNSADPNNIKSLQVGYQYYEPRYDLSTGQ